MAPAYNTPRPSTPLGRGTPCSGVLVNARWVCACGASKLKPMVLTPALLLLPLAAPPQDSLAEHALFSRLTLEEIPCHRSVRLLVQAPVRADAEHTASVTELYGPWIEAAASAIDNEYGIPNRLESQAKEPLDIVILGSIPSYKNAQRYVPHPTDDYERVVLVEPPGILTTRWDRTLKRAPGHELRTPLLRLATRELLKAYQAVETPLEPWLLGGIPAFIVHHGPDATPESLAHPAPWAAALERLRALVEDEERREQFLIPLAELIDCPGPKEAAELGMKHARLADIKLGHHPYDLPGTEIFTEQAALWIHFFHQGRGGRYQEAFRNYVAKALHANGGSEPLMLTLGLGEPEELETPFLAHMDMLLGGNVIALPEIVLAPRAKVHHAGILPEKVDVDGLRISALARAVDGDLEGAIMELEKASLESTDPSLRRGLLEEQARLMQAQDMRRKFVASLLGSSRKLRLTRGEESVSVVLAGFSDDILYFKPGRTDLEQLPIGQLVPGDVVRSMGNRAADHGPGWVAVYLALLDQDERWDRKFDREAEGAAALERALEEGLVERIQAAHLQAHLRTLATTPEPTAPFEAEALLVLCRQATEMDHSGALAADLWKSARPALAQVAGSCWAFLFDRAGAEGLVTVPITPLKDDRIRLTYDFNQPAEVEDFMSAGDYLLDRSQKLFTLESQVSTLAVAGGEWRGRGHAAFRHPLVLLPPLRVRYEVVYGRPRPGKGLESTVFVGICDDGAGNYVGAWDLFDLEAIDIPSRQIELDYEEGERSLKSATPYSIELRHDGKHAELWVDGKPKKKVAADARTSGALIVLVHSQVTVAIRRLEIEGKLDPEAMGAARDLWVAGQVQGMGL